MLSQDVPAGLMRKVRSQALAPGGHASSDTLGGRSEENQPKHVRPLDEKLVSEPIARSQRQSELFTLASPSFLSYVHGQPSMRWTPRMCISPDTHEVVVGAPDMTSPPDTSGIALQVQQGLLPSSYQKPLRTAALRHASRRQAALSRQRQAAPPTEGSGGAGAGQRPGSTSPALPGTPCGWSQMAGEAASCW